MRKVVLGIIRDLREFFMLPFFTFYPLIRFIHIFILHFVPLSPCRSLFFPLISPEIHNPVYAYSPHYMYSLFLDSMARER